MSDKAPATKLTIGIEDIGDKRECVAAIRKLHSALREHYGRREADNLFLSKEDLRSPEWQVRLRFDQACYSFIDQAHAEAQQRKTRTRPRKEK